jgi:hypothetical protein
MCAAMRNDVCAQLTAFALSVCYVRQWHRYQRWSIGGRDDFYVDRRYTNLRPIGDGSYGFVCAADDTTTGDQVCLALQCSSSALQPTL